MSDLPTERHVMYVERASNPMGTAAFVLSLVAFFSAGLFAPISLLLSLLALRDKPKDLAAAGLVLSLVGMISWLLVWMFLIVPWLIAIGVIASSSASAPARRNAPAPPTTVASTPTVSVDSLRVSNVKLTKQKSGRDYLVSMDLQNSANAAIKRVSLQMDVVDSNGEQLGKDVFKLAIPTRLAPGVSRPFEIALPRYSPLNMEVPASAKIIVTVLDVQSE